MQQPDEIVRSLQTLLDDDPSLADVLEKSLRSAAERAAKELDADVYDVLDWPRDLPQYYDYLSRFVRWIPQQTDAPAWKTSAPQERYAKEVSDRLAHFFWLVDQKADVSQAAIAENSPKFRGWLTEFAREWGSFLDTTASFDDDILQSFLREAPEYTIEESLIDGRPNTPSGWLTFNQFFARELNAGLRPISAPADNRVVTSPADCSFRHCYDIDADSNIPATAVKGRHYGNITQLIDGSRFADTFAGGTFVHYMLPPSAYHRFHVPVAGTVEEAFVISGQVYMQVDLEDHQLKARDSAHTGYEFFQNRGVLTVDTSTSGNGDLGVVAVVPVGMSHVGSVNLTAARGTQVAKGEEFGFFAFGGSDIIVLFQRGVHPEIDTSTKARKVGSVIARCRR
ncbi:phosphatidylserine decarboxylase [Mycolicibacterium aromaticivorans JS19b1 = JCM 16368]|uniref:Phosphatidylserine decarboxylase n=1 Tax=Mycolicibacterium aromaticivorans JS19b1 = JCM 16368 TaxID=1440774 RepID=A0A064CEL5_9MYCO|nr:phosphatidylserine decarboxylase [Mycolicibacterium aromaticivorans]KDE98131.1 phosphatidylserine decarboxylase [Mycolicibacterium aromaticivorans JS19b1 = JCM 16368]